jgi:anti-sigma factor RsiW
MQTDRACRRTVLALPWLLNGSLGADERRAVREHLIGCPACRAELGRTREALAIVQAARAAAPAPAPGSFEAARRRRIGHGSMVRLAWAAMIGAVVASAGALWWANSRTETAARAEHLVRPRTTINAQSTAAAQPLSAIDFEGGGLASLETVRSVSPAHAHSPGHAARTTQPSPRTISTIDFEGGAPDERH